MSLLRAVPGFLALATLTAAAQTTAPLPAGVHVVWDPATAFREATPTRERICINGLWRWQPAPAASDTPPTSSWGFFKVPGSWPGITDYMQKDSQSVIAHPDWAAERLGSLTGSWYQREITVPAAWAGRRIVLAADYVNSFATVWIDGTPRGEIRFPSGELDLTSACKPGATHTLSIHVAALPLQAVLLSYTDTNTAREVKGRVARRGLCGDVFLASMPADARINDIKIETSVRRREITFDVALQALANRSEYQLEAAIVRAGERVATFTSPPFRAAELAGGRVRFSHAWLPDALWDLHTPDNTYTVRCTLRGPDGRVADAHGDVRFGFREFWIEGRDFFLNGSRIGLSAVPLDNAQVSTALASYAGARESLLRLKSIGINFVYTHNYGCQPGSHLSFAEILRAADDVGMLVAFSQPHFSHYDWKAGDADERNGYAAHAAFYVRVAQNHPSVVAYSTSHNATGYAEDMNPHLIDGLQDPREAPARRNASLALRAEALIRRIDASRVIYHHSSGNLGAMHTSNFYPNFVPPQELSDWFEHWGTVGVKPLFLCEYGAPFTWDWTMYRGWYQGERAFGSAQVPWQFSLAEWNAQFLGDRAYRISAREAANLRWEAKQLQAGKVWHRWDYPTEVGSREFDERYPVIALYVRDNWPAFRTWGVSAISPWEFGHYWKLRPGVDKGRQDLPVDWSALQRPGFSPDYIGALYERMDLAFQREDWIATPAAEALLRYNQPLLAYIAGKPAAFTSKDHLFTAGETLEKQLIVINNSRTPVQAEASWSLDLPRPGEGTARLTLAPGAQQRVPLRFTLPESPAAGDHTLHAIVRFSSGETQTDTFRLHVLPRPDAALLAPRIAVFDPAGETTALLARLGIRGEPVDAAADLARHDLLIVGKAALSVTSPAPDISRVRTGLKVVIFEQSSEVLEKRFGFRVAEHGLRQIFPRLPDHPALAGLGVEQLRDWRGEATLLPPRLTYTTRPRMGPTVNWCDLPVTRLWRCGNRGNVASVLIEKPACGDFLPIVDGGFSLQYSPLLEFRTGQGLVVFCQIDVSGRSEPEPAADTLTRNLLRHVADWKGRPAGRAVYLGEPAGQAHLAAAGVVLASDAGTAFSAEDVLVLGPGAAGGDPALQRRVREFLRGAGRALAIGLEQPELDGLMPQPVTVARREHIVTYLDPAPRGSAFAGIASADTMNRDPRPLPLVAAGAGITGNGVLATAASGRIVLCAIVPWHFDPAKQSNLKRTFRRASALVTRLLANQGVTISAPVLERFAKPVSATESKPRWSEGLYLEQPEEWDDPYRFFRW